MRRHCADLLDLVPGWLTLQDSSRIHCTNKFAADLYQTFLAHRAVRYVKALERDEEWLESFKTGDTARLIRVLGAAFRGER